MKKFLLSLFAGILAASIVNAGVLDWAIKGGDNGGAFGKLADDDTVNTNGRPAGYTVYLFFCTDYDAVVALLNGGEAFDLDAFEDYALASTDANNNTSKAQVLSKAGANGGAIISSEDSAWSDVRYLRRCLQYLGGTDH